MHARTHTHTHTQRHTVGFYGLRGLSKGVMVFILYKLYVLLPYTYPTPKLSPHRRRCISIFPKKTHSIWFIRILNYGDTENVLINHLLLVIPMLYTCHYTKLCPHKPHKHAHTCTRLFLWNMGTFHMCNGFYTVQTVFFSIALHRTYTETYPLQETVCIFTFSNKKLILYDL